jgi:hypothetical protein
MIERREFISYSTAGKPLEARARPHACVSTAHVQW